MKRLFLAIHVQPDAFFRCQKLGHTLQQCASSLVFYVREESGHGDGTLARTRLTALTALGACIKRKIVSFVPEREICPRT
jgi:hypothetical protein